MIFEVTSSSVQLNERRGILQQAIGMCPKVDLIFPGNKRLDSLLDGGSMVTLVTDSYYNKYLKNDVKIKEHMNAHELFQLSTANSSSMECLKYFECDIDFLGLKVPRVGILVTKDPYKYIEKCKIPKHRSPGVIGFNLVKLAYEEVIRTESIEIFENFDKPDKMNPLLFAQLSIYFWSKVRGVHNDSEQPVSTSEIDCEEINEENLEEFDDEIKIVDQVTIGSNHKPICIPANSSKIIYGKNKKGKKGRKRGNMMLQKSRYSNMPAGLELNECLIGIKTKRIPVILINTNSYNVWIRKVYLAADMCEVDVQEWENEITLDMVESNKVTVNIRRVVPEHLKEQVEKQYKEEVRQARGDVELDEVEENCNISSTEEQNSNDEEQSSDHNCESSNNDQKTSKSESEEIPSFKERPDVESNDFDFKKCIEDLPFKMNIGEVDLSLEQQKRLINMIYDHEKVFSLHDGDLGYCDVIKHTIPTTTDKPVYLAHRSIPPQLQTEVRKCLDTWIKQGIIRPSRSPYASQVVLVRKKTGDLRLCVDFRKINSITIRDAFPLPRIDEALQSVRQSQWFSSIDLAQGYLQLAMEPEDIGKTAFRAGSSGLYEFTRMPFGLSNAGSSFCRLMEMCLGDQQFVTLLLYIDDICIFAPDEDTMLDRMELVFKRLAEFNLKVKPKKCFWFQKKVLFLGYQLSSEGISANPEKVEKVANWPVPVDIRELQSFIGLASYYRRFIKKFSEWSKCLHELIGPEGSVKKSKRKKVTPESFVWKEEHQEAFDNLKEALTTSPVLAYPDFSKPFILETDASFKGLGAVLSQKDEKGRMRVIAYASRGLRGSEKNMNNYSSAKLELLGLKWAVTQKLRNYLLGSKFTVYTDNNPLAHIKDSGLGAAQIRWLSDLALFDFDIIYRTGKSNLAADALSRRPGNEIEDEDSDDDDDEQMIASIEVQAIIQEFIEGTVIPHHLDELISEICPCVLCVTSEIAVEENLPNGKGMTTLPSISPKKMKTQQKNDSEIGTIYRHISGERKLAKRDVSKIRAKNARKYFYQCDNLELRNGVLHRITNDGIEEYHQLVLPLEYRHKVLKMLHDDMGHQGEERTIQLVRERFYWTGMANDIVRYVNHCKRCNTAKGHYQGVNTQQGSLEAERPLELLCMDFTVIDQSKTGKENVLVLTDVFTKFSQAYVTPNQKAITVAKILVDKWFPTYGVPTRVHSDQGKSFDNNVIDSICHMYGIKRSMTTPYNPRGNSQCERFNRTLHNLLKTLAKEEKGNWPKYLPSLIFAYNATPHSSTGLQPYQLMFGRKAQTPCDSWLGLSKYEEDKPISKFAWVQEQKEYLLSANKRAQRGIKLDKERSKKRTGGKELSIPKGNLVLIRDHPPGRNKIQDNYKSAPYVVVGLRKDQNVYDVQTPGKKGKIKTYNRRQLYDLKINEDNYEKNEEAEVIVDVPHLIPKATKEKSPKNTRSDKKGYNLRSNPKKKVLFYAIENVIGEEDAEINQKENYYEKVMSMDVPCYHQFHVV